MSRFNNMFRFAKLGSEESVHPDEVGKMIVYLQCEKDVTVTRSGDGYDITKDNNTFHMGIVEGSRTVKVKLYVKETVQ